MGASHIHTERAHLQLKLDGVRDDIVRWWLSEKHSVAYVKEQLKSLYDINVTVGQVQFALHRWKVSRLRNTRSSRLMKAIVNRVYAKRQCEHCKTEYQPSSSLQIYCKICAPDKMWWRRIKQFGVNKSTFDAMLEEQTHNCAICKCLINYSARIDHDHATGLVRGLLCGHCNLKLSVVEDTTFLAQAKMYLHQHVNRSTT